MLAFYNTIDWFRPSFVLMENVLDIFKKGDGLYAKMAASILLDMDYQTRTGIIAACHHGAPQGRWRYFSGSLPPTPHPCSSWQGLPAVQSNRIPVLLSMDCQMRNGIIAACHHGSPQGRWRCSERDTSLLFYPLLLQPHSESTQVTDASP